MFGLLTFALGLGGDTNTIPSTPVVGTTPTYYIYGF